MRHISLHRATSRRARRGATIVESLVSLAIFLVGVVAILNYFPHSVRAAYDAADLSVAVMLAQMKAEEIRRDDDSMGSLVAAIQARATPTEAKPFFQDDRLTYAFSGVSLVDPADAPNTARVIVRYNAEYRSSEDVLYELKFQ